jgi:hypothetical protein
MKKQKRKKKKGGYHSFGGFANGKKKRSVYDTGLSFRMRRRREL